MARKGFSQAMLDVDGQVTVIQVNECSMLPMFVDVLTFPCNMGYVSGVGTA